MADVTNAKKKYRENTTAGSYRAGLEKFADEYAEENPSMSDADPLTQLEEAFADSVFREKGEYSKGVARFISQSDEYRVRAFDVDSREWANKTANSEWASKSLRSSIKYSSTTRLSSHKWFAKYADAYSSDE